jgi:hypothetical protein
MILEKMIVKEGASERVRDPDESQTTVDFARGEAKAI